jgi:molecular chaperone GrpE
MSEETKNTAAELSASANDQKEAAIAASAPAVEPASEVAILREQLRAKEEEAKNNYERFIRQTAEIENFKKRAIRDKEDTVRFANEALVKDLLPVVDNLERAIAHAKGGGNGESLVEGVEMILKGLFDALGKHGVSQISAVGQPFNPQLHEAMAQVESDSGKPNTVLEEHQKGYLLRERLLRPALVTVVKGPRSNEKKNHNDQVENSPTDD